MVFARIGLHCRKKCEKSKRDNRTMIKSKEMIGSTNEKKEIIKIQICD